MPFDMPVDGDDDNEKTPDFSQMSLSDFIRDPRVPISLRDARLLQIQKASQNAGEMKVSDFLRRDLTEEERHLRKKQSELQNWLDEMRFKQFSAEIKGFISEQKDVIETEIQTIQQSVNTLLIDDADHGGPIGDLRDARGEFRSQARELERLERTRQRARTDDDLISVHSALQAQARRTATASNNWRQTFMNYWDGISTNFRKGITTGAMMAATAPIAVGLHYHDKKKNDDSKTDTDDTASSSAVDNKPEFDPT